MIDTEKQFEQFLSWKRKFELGIAQVFDSHSEMMLMDASIFGESQLREYKHTLELQEKVVSAIIKVKHKTPDMHDGTPSDMP